jgi:hypothetical protein
VAYTAVVYAYNMWHPCTVYVHVYTQYVHVYAMNIHVLTSCFNMMGRVQLMPLFLAGNSTSTIPHKYSQHKRSGFPKGTCDTAAVDDQLGSNVYEVNPWLWQFGRGTWLVYQLRRLMPGRKKRSLREAETVAGVARLIGPDGK